MGGKTGKMAALLVFLAAWAYAATVAELIDKSEELWLQHKYNESAAALDEALKAGPTDPQKANIYWRKARNLYDLAEGMPREAKKARLANYLAMQELARKCLEANPRMGECYLWLGSGLGREGTQKGILNMLGRIAEIEELWLKCIKLKPAYRAVNGSSNALGDAFYALGQFYRLVPDWNAVKLLYKTRGDKQKSVAMLRKAVELEPKRVEYAKELGISLICLGQSTENQQAVDEGIQWLKKVATLPSLKTTDDIDKQHSKMILQNMDLACGYSRDAQQDISEETFKKKKRP